MILIFDTHFNSQRNWGTHTHNNQQTAWDHRCHLFNKVDPPWKYKGCQINQTHKHTQTHRESMWLMCGSEATLLHWWSKKKKETSATLNYLLLIWFPACGSNNTQQSNGERSRGREEKIAGLIKSSPLMDRSKQTQLSPQVHDHAKPLSLCLAPHTPIDQCALLSFVAFVLKMCLPFL